jgi:pSer/pThr/pTyr-binding forkhead associated (FHA) protein
VLHTERAAELPSSNGGILSPESGPRAPRARRESELATRVDIDGDPLARHSLSPRELQDLLAAERRGQPFLALRNPRGGLLIFALGRGGQARTLGRRAEMDLALPWDNEVSGLHAELQGLGGEWTLVDDGLSRNGTYVNDERVRGRQRLRDGDRIQLGRTTLVFNAAHSAPIDETATAGDRPTLPRLTDTQRRVLIALCRPYRDSASYATPASNLQIADEVFLSIDAVKMNLRTLFAKFELSNLPQNQKRARLAECVLKFGVISERDLA